MILALYYIFPFILDRNLPKANCTGNRVCTPCDTVVFGSYLMHFFFVGTVQHWPAGRFWP